MFSRACSYKSSEADDDVFEYGYDVNVVVTKLTWKLSATLLAA